MRVDSKLILSIILTAISIFVVAPLFPTLLKQVVFVTLSLYTLPFMNLRNQFRGMVYETDSWTINVKLVFGREIKVLFSNKELEDSEIQVANRYRLYLSGYLLLLFLLSL